MDVKEVLNHEIYQESTFKRIIYKLMFSHLFIFDPILRVAKAFIVYV